MSFVGISELDKEIILNSEFDEIIRLIKTSSNLRKLIIELLPEFIEKYNSNHNDYDDNDLYLFVTLLLENNELEIVSKIIKLYREIIGKEFYDLLLDELINEKLDYLPFVVKIIDMAPKNYNWAKVPEIFLEHYRDIYDNYLLQISKEMLMFVNAALIVDNLELLIILKDAWQPFKKDIENHYDDIPEEDKIAQQIDDLFKYKFR